MHKIIIAGKLIQILLAILSIRLLTSLLSLSEVAKYGIAISISLMLTAAIGSPISMYFNRVAHELLERKVLVKAFNYFFFLVSFVSLLIYGIAYFLIDINVLRWNISQDIIKLSVLIFFSSTINWALINVINTLGDGKSYSLLTIITIGSGVLLSYWLCTVMHNSHSWWILGVVVSQITVAIYAYYIILRKEKRNYIDCNKSIYQISGDLVRFKTILQFAAPISIISIFSSFLMNWYKWISFDGLNFKDLGLIVGCFIFSAGLFNAVEQTSAAIFQPNFYKSLSSKEGSVKAFAWNRYAERMIGTLILAFAAYLSTLEFVSKVFLSSQFYHEIKLLIFCGIADFIRIICNILLIRYDSTMKTRDGILPSFFSAVILVLILMAVDDAINLHAVPLVSIVIFSILLFGHLIKLSVEGISFVNTFGTATICLSIAAAILIAIPVWLASYTNLNYIHKSALCLLLALFGFGYAWLKIIKPHRI